MTRKRWLHVLLAAGLCLALAATAMAAYKSGSYKGTTGQTDSRTGKPFTLKFRISNGMIKKVDTGTRDKCPDGTFLRVHQNAFKATAIDSKGRFVLRAGSDTQPAVMKGKVKGKKASGTITDKTLDPEGSGLCTASTAWTAKVK